MNKSAFCSTLRDTHRKTASSDAPGVGGKAVKALAKRKAASAPRELLEDDVDQQEMLPLRERVRARM